MKTHPVLAIASYKTVKPSVCFTSVIARCIVISLECKIFKCEIFIWDHVDGILSEKKQHNT